MMMLLFWTVSRFKPKLDSIPTDQERKGYPLLHKGLFVIRHQRLVAL
jgi:hypothetical protein